MGVVDLCSIRVLLSPCS